MQRRLFITGLIIGLVGGSQAVLAGALVATGPWYHALPCVLACLWAACMLFRMLRALAEQDMNDAFSAYET